MTGWLKLGVGVDFVNVFSTMEAVRKSYPYIFIGPLILFIFPLVMLWEYLRLYGILGFAAAGATGLLVGRIVTPGTTTWPRP